MFRISTTVSALALIGALACNPAAAVPRAFVASDGSDANTAMNCNLANPCRHFMAAMTVVDIGGEVVALDAAGYGAVTITRSITLTANPGYHAVISAAAGNAVTIATPGVNVVLRGLNIKGNGARYGVRMTDGARLSIENCVISNFLDSFDGSGVIVETAAKVQIVDSMFRDNEYGIYLKGGSTSSISGTKAFGNGRGIFVHGIVPGTVTTAAISDSVLSSNGGGIYVYAFLAGTTARASVTRSTVVNNFTGMSVLSGSGTQELTISNNLVTGNTDGLTQAQFSGGTSTLKSLGNNTVDQNSTDLCCGAPGTITPLSGM